MFGLDLLRTRSLLWIKKYVCVWGFCYLCFMVAERSVLSAAMVSMEEMRVKRTNMASHYDQKLNEMEQSFLGLSVTLETKLKETQKKIQEDQMNVIDQAA